MRLIITGRIAVIIDSIGGSSELIKSISTGNRVCISSNSGGISCSKTSVIIGVSFANILCIVGIADTIRSANCFTIGITAEPIELNIPVKAVFTRSILSPSSAPASTISPLITPPKSSHSCFQAAIPSEPSASNGARSA